MAWGWRVALGWGVGSGWVGWRGVGLAVWGWHWVGGLAVCEWVGGYITKVGTSIKPRRGTAIKRRVSTQLMENQTLYCMLRLPNPKIRKCAPTKLNGRDLLPKSNRPGTNLLSKSVIPGTKLLPKMPTEVCQLAHLAG